jgi:hypothetical protein
MQADRSEMHGLAAQTPERVMELARRYCEWEARARVIPWERAGWYMAWHGYGTYGQRFRQEYADAMVQADPSDVVEGTALGD